MNRYRIDQPQFLEQDGLSFSFNMVNYIAHEKYDDHVFEEICKAVSKCYKSQIPISTRLLGNYRICPIPPHHTLYEYLDKEAQEMLNFLVFLLKDNNVFVVWFGPFGADDKLLNDTIVRVHRSYGILKEIVEAMSSEKNGQSDIEKAKTDLVESYWKKVREVLTKIEAKKTELTGFAYEVFDKPTADKLTKQLRASTGKVLIKGVAAVLLAEIAEEIGRKIVAMLAAKTAAKAATKSSKTGVSRIAAKSVPVLGLAIGMGFGVWRFWNGDTTGAGLEVMSGAAACFPGTGTATSLAIDAGLIARDVYEAKRLGSEEVEELSDEMHALDRSLNDLYEHYDNVMADYEFVKEVLNIGFTVRNFEQEVKILERIVNNIESVYNDFDLI